jgi:hypothetical protein
MEQSLESYLESKFNVSLLPTHKFQTVKAADELIKRTPIEEVSSSNEEPLVTFQ